MPTASSPLVVEVTRGPLVESRHAGILAVSDSAGRLEVSAGDVGRAVFPRSSAKLIQALPLVETGAADALGLTVEELAIAGASHNGEEAHVATALSMLRKAGLDGSALECGCQWPERGADVARLNRAGEVPTALHNNCSGKHAGFLCVACRLGAVTAGYVEPDHPVQREVTAALSALTDTPLDETVMGIDGCSIPTYAVPLDRLARAFARLGTGIGLGAARSDAAVRLRKAAAAAPFMVAGTGRFCTEVMTRFGERAYVKTGAEGVFCAIFPDAGLGVALKVDDGGTRASEALMAAVMERFVARDDEERAFLSRWSRRTLTNRRDITVGEVRLAADSRAALAA
ncbi:asparaginase [Pseudoxanthobacter soli DSM 19599]|uniref:Asparaginase n=1 Tax=Pseudoxanthobacter soli DSM 19599 TaxID=1123029 RepID=A0A1M7Z7J6_9HYPH|nr:asparaginase [Pseudoxanthobacter soli]SHO60913.1 asparaginase [Pseudoxanthobacter soli DSM 19599]